MCKIPRCSNPAVAHGLCAKHYMRQRRHGDPTVTHPPGVDLAGWRKKVAALERELARAQATAKPSVSCTACADKDREIARLKAANADLHVAAGGMPRTPEELARAKVRADERRKAERAAKREAAGAAKPAEIPDEKTKQEYERLIKSLRTQLRNKIDQYDGLKIYMLHADKAVKL